MIEPLTYFILRNTDYAPDDLIQLGQLIPDPRLPYRRLAAPLQPAPAPRISRKTSWAFEKSKSSTGTAGVFNQFLAAFTAKAFAHASRGFEQTWTAATLETRCLELGTDDEYVRQSVLVEPVQKWLKEHKILGKTVYMVTGVKSAMKPGEATYGTIRSHGGGVTLGVDPGTGGLMGVGAEHSLTKNEGTLETSSQETDFVFAYRLRKVHIGWRDRITLGGDVEGADLHGVGDWSDDEGLGSSDEEAGESGPAREVEIDHAQLEETDFGSLLPAKDVKTVGIDDDGEECMVILPSV